ncbi:MULTISPECIES: hypothetical protein [Acinetobacter]|uniref:Uncharacterized protein n=1 Tax=Acinetobacter indicus TaxID=756892 RepID=A0A6C0Y882_9GAMM|nr:MULTISPECIES: hypothetical protein [Acinetobacter]QIC72072.1 hypothetical protein FSC09_17085 [Acinetobacter indicus]QKQ71527.1 hypothetical protein E5Y90_14945 [Acinetobacter sp. 10FS3-1]
MSNSKANLEIIELHKVAYDGEPGCDKYNINAQLEECKKIRSDYAIHEIQFDRTNWTRNTNIPHALPELCKLKFVGYSVGPKDAAHEISNSTYTCNLYWSASECLLLQVQKAGELPNIEICYSLKELLEQLAYYHTDLEFKQGNIAENILKNAVQYSEWNFDGESNLIYGNNDVTNFSQFLDLVNQSLSLGFKPYIYKVRMKPKPLPDQRGLILFTAKQIAVEHRDISDFKLAQQEIVTRKEKVNSNIATTILFLTQDSKIIEIISDAHRITGIQASTGIKIERTVFNDATYKKTSSLDDLETQGSYFYIGTPIYNAMLVFLKTQEPPVYLDYVLTNDNERDIEFDGRLIGYACEVEDEITTLSRLYQTRRGNLICHQLVKNQDEELLRQEALVSNDHEEIVQFFGCSANIKRMYREAGINANITVE